MVSTLCALLNRARNFGVFGKRIPCSTHRSEKLALLYELSTDIKDLSIQLAELGVFLRL